MMIKSGREEGHGLPWTQILNSAERLRVPKPSLLALRFASCLSYGSGLATDVGESEKGLPTCVSVMVRYVLLKCIGTKLTELVK